MELLKWFLSVVDALLHKRYWAFCLIYPYLFHRYRNFPNVWRITKFLNQTSRRDFSFTCVFGIIYMSAIQRSKMQAEHIILNCLVATFKIYIYKYTYIVAQFSHSVVSNSLRPHKSQHARPPCPSPTLGVYPNPYPSSQWYHPTISSSVVPFSSCPQSLPASGSFPISQLFAWVAKVLEFQL